jgi:hypothetical protein
MQPYIKRQVKRDIFDVVLIQEGFSPAPENPKAVMADLIKATELGLIRSREFRKNATNSVGNCGKKLERR